MSETKESKKYKKDDELTLDLISNLISAVGGMIPVVGPVLKPIISFILHSTFDVNGKDDLFIKIIDAKIAEYAYETAIGEFKSFVETGNLLEKSIEELKNNNIKNNKEIKKISNELISRNEICMNNALRIINIYMEVGKNNSDALDKIHPIIAMTAFMYCGLVLDTIKHGKEWGYSTIDGLQTQLENKSDEVFRYLIEKKPNGPYPYIASALNAQQSLIYFRKGYNNLDTNLDVRLNIKKINDEIFNPSLKKGRKNILVGSAFSNYNKNYGGYDAVAYDIPVHVIYQMKISANIKVEQNTTGTLKINIIHSCIGFNPTGTFIEIFFDETSVEKMQLYPPYWEDQSNIIDVFHHGDKGSNYKDIRYIKMKDLYINNVKNVRFDIYNYNEFDCQAPIYHVEATIE